MYSYEKNINGIFTKAFFYEEDIQNVFIPLLNKLVSLYKEKNRRIICYIAAAPGTGKSTLVSFLEDIFKSIYHDISLQVIGMDGFHHHTSYLKTHYATIDNHKVMLNDIKGSYLTFDVDKLLLKVNELTIKKEICWPYYDRNLHNPIEDKIKVNSDIVIIEGNYLLLKEPPYDRLIQYADYTIYIDANINMLKERLINRKKASNNIDIKQAIEFVENSDLKNAIKCKENSAKPNLNLILNLDGHFTIKQ